jgi:hypothetical protein
MVARHTPICNDCCSIDIAGILRCQKERNLHDLLRAAQSFERNLLASSAQKSLQPILKQLVQMVIV